jgi:hypothetical protein
MSVNTCAGISLWILRSVTQLTQRTFPRSTYQSLARATLPTRPLADFGNAVYFTYAHKISTHSFICSGVHIADRVFVGHDVRSSMTSTHAPATPTAHRRAGRLVAGRDLDRGRRRDPARGSPRCAARRVRRLVGEMPGDASCLAPVKLGVVYRSVLSWLLDSAVIPWLLLGERSAAMSPTEQGKGYEIGVARIRLLPVT